VELHNNVKQFGWNKIIHRHAKEVIYNVGKFLKGRQRGELF
jgi:hypothetical protein